MSSDSGSLRKVNKLSCLHIDIWLWQRAVRVRGSSSAKMSQPNGSQLVYEYLKQIHKDDIEEMDLKWQSALLSMRTRRFFQKTGRKITINESDTARYDKLKSYMTDDEVPTNMALIAFSDSEAPSGGVTQILLPVKIGDAEHFTYIWVNFMVVRSPSPYNGIIGRPRVRKIQVVPSTTYGMLKFLVPGGILTLRSSRIIPLECTMVSGMKARPFDIIQATEDIIKVAINPEYPEQTIAIGSTITEEGQKALCDLLRRNLDIFA
ncbi:hypothetical protein Tco_0073398 [Tanacetum coccineum]